MPNASAATPQKELVDEKAATDAIAGDDSDNKPNRKEIIEPPPTSPTPAEETPSQPEVHIASSHIFSQFSTLLILFIEKCLHFQADRTDATKIISVRNSDSSTSSTSNSSGISVSSSTPTTPAAPNKESTANTSMITINSDLPDLSNSLASNVSQVTVVTTSHPPVIIDNSVAPKPPPPQTKSSSGNEVFIVSNEMNKSLPMNESSTDDDYPSLDSLECNSSRKQQQQKPVSPPPPPGQSTIIIGDSTSTPVSPTPYTPNKHQHPRARKLDESEVFIVSNEDESTLSDSETNKTNKNLDTSHVSVVTVGDEIRVKDSSNAKTPLRQSNSSINTSVTSDM